MNFVFSIISNNQAMTNLVKKSLIRHTKLCRKQLLELVYRLKFCLTKYVKRKPNKGDQASDAR